MVLFSIRQDSSFKCRDLSLCLEYCTLGINLPGAGSVAIGFRSTGGAL